MDRRAKLAKRVSDLEARLDELTDRRDEIESQLERAKEDVEEAQAAFEPAGDTSTITEAQAERDALEEALGRLNREVETARKELQEARGRLEEQKRIGRLKDATETAAEAWKDYACVLREAKEAVREKIDEAAAAKRRLVDARSAFTENLEGSGREARIQAAREVLSNGTDRHREGLTHMVSDAERASLDGVTRPESALSASERPEHPVDAPFLAKALRKAVRPLVE